MKHAIQWVRSFIFFLQMYFMLPVIGLVWAPWAYFSSRGAYSAIHAYCSWVRWTAGWMVGLKTEIRGPVPTGEILVCSKHQSFLDILMIASVVPEPKFIMKHSLRYAPVIGFYGKMIGCIPVQRGRRSEAMRKMVLEARRTDTPKGQLIIYPQGTRVAPGVDAPYKIGAGVLYREMKQRVHPAGTNVGVFWPRLGIFRKPGVAVVEFLDPIEAGLPVSEFMAKVEEVIEESSDKLMREAGFKLPKDAASPAAE
jgi:1-acyl-sn-glycerol-3-phosphate acyltransferase